MEQYIQALREYMGRDYREMYREAGEVFPYGFITPGSASYEDCLWDWDSYFSDVALRQILKDNNADASEAREYERGCVLNFLDFTYDDGYMPIVVDRRFPGLKERPTEDNTENMHKPVLAQHAAFLVMQDDGDVSWLKDGFEKLQAYIKNYMKYHKHVETGLYYWQTDKMIGVDNDPCTFFRPNGSSASIYLNCLMVKELAAMVYLCDKLGYADDKEVYAAEKSALEEAIRTHCYDERDGFFYNVDLNLREVKFADHEFLHKGAPRNWDCLIQRIDVWSGFMALWAGVATKEQAARVVERYKESETFNCNAGVRTLSKLEKMYQVVPSNNPSCWLGPVWGISNYLTFRGLLNYGYENEARELCEKTIRLFGEDMIKNGVMHEYYDPDSCEPVINPGFQNWNMLVLNMIYWYEGKQVIEEF